MRASDTVDQTSDTAFTKPTPTLERTVSSILIGTGLAFAGGMLWGVNATVSKILMANYHANPMWIACVRELAAGVIFLICAAIFTPKQFSGMLGDRRSYPKLLLCSLTCVLLVQVSYLKAIDWTNSGMATMLQTLNLLFVLAIVCVKGKRLPGSRESLGVTLAFMGTVLIATGGDITQFTLPLPGLLWGLGDALGTALLAILPITVMAKWGNFAVNGVMFVISGLILAPFVRPITTAPSLDMAGIALMVFTVVGGTFGAYWLFLAGSQRCGAMRATLLGTSEPIIATITGVMFTGATFSLTDWIGFTLIILMVFLVR